MVQEHQAAPPKLALILESIFLSEGYRIYRNSKEFIGTAAVLREMKVLYIGQGEESKRGYPYVLIHELGHLLVKESKKVRIAYFTVMPLLLSKKKQPLQKYSKELRLIIDNEAKAWSAGKQFLKRAGLKYNEKEFFKTAFEGLYSYASFLPPPKTKKTRRQ